MSVRNKLKEKFYRVQSPIGRWVNVAAIFIMSLTSIGSYFILQYMICVDGACEKLKVMKLAITFSPFFILFGIIGIFTANIIRTNKHIRVAESDALTFITVFGALFILLLALGVWREAEIYA